MSHTLTTDVVCISMQTSPGSRCDLWKQSAHIRRPSGRVSRSCSHRSIAGYDSGNVRVPDRVEVEDFPAAIYVAKEVTFFSL